MITKHRGGGEEARGWEAGEGMNATEIWIRSPLLPFSFSGSSSNSFDLLRELLKRKARLNVCTLPSISRRDSFSWRERSNLRQAGAKYKPLFTTGVPFRRLTASVLEQTWSLGGINWRWNGAKRQRLGREWVRKARVAQCCCSWTGNWSAVCSSWQSKTNRNQSQAFNFVSFYGAQREHVLIF